MEHLMPRQYPTHFRRDRVDRTLADESVVFLVRTTSAPEQTLHWRKHQALINEGPVDGLTEGAELRPTNKHFTAFEKELKLVKETSELFDA